MKVVEKWGVLTAQTRPRTGGRSRGVPPGGAFDATSHAIANALVGNPLDAIALEFAGDRLRLVPSRPTIAAVVGAAIKDPRFPGRVRLAAGEELDLFLPGPGSRVSVAVPGLDHKLNHPIDVGATLTFVAGREADPIRLAAPLTWIGQPALRYCPEIETDAVTPLTVTHQISRHGLKLTGEVSGLRPLEFSEPSVVGLIQVSPDGTVLIHGPDGPTIGGYGRMGVVISADIPALAQLRPGDRVDLTPVSLDHARRVADQDTERLAQLLTHLAWTTGLRK